MLARCPALIKELVMKYEMKKIIHKKSIWIMCAIFILANLILLKEFDKHQDANAVTYEYTKADYLDFLEQIPEQTKELSRQPAYERHDTFLYRNLMKTERDYSELTGDGFVKGKFTAFNHYAAYPYQILFIIMCAFMTAYQMVPAERKQGYFLLLKSARNGHLGLYRDKAMALSLYIVAFSLACDVTEIIFIRYRYGAFHVGALIQSSSVFRNCPYAITIGQAMVIMSVLHIAIAVFSVFLILMLFAVFKRNEISLAIYAAFFIVEWLLSQKVAISGGANILAAVNPFYQSVADTILGNYLNVNLLGFPVSQMTAGVGFIIVFGIVFFACGVMAFSYSFQIEGDSFFGKMMRRFRKKLSGIWHTDRVAVFESGKILIHEKQIIVLAIFVLMIIGFSRQALSPLIFTKPEDAEYHRLASHVQGKVTEKKLRYIEKQRNYLDDLMDEASTLGDSSADEARSQYIQFEYEHRDGGLSKLEGQRDVLLQRTERDKYFFDEAALNSQLSDVNTDLMTFLIAGIVLVLTLCGIESYDTQIHPLLNTTEAGYRLIRMKKVKTAFVLAIIYYLLWNIPDFISYFRIDHGKNLMAPMTELTTFAIQKPVTELVFFITLAGIRFAIFMAFTAFVLKLTTWFKSQAAVGVIGILIIVMITLICALTETDIVQILLKAISFT